MFIPPEEVFIRKIALALTRHPRMGTWTLLFLWIKKEVQLTQLPELYCTGDPHLDSCATAFLSHGKQLAEKKFVSPFLILYSSSTFTFANLSSSRRIEFLKKSKASVSSLNHWMRRKTTAEGENTAHFGFFFTFETLNLTQRSQNWLYSLKNLIERWTNYAKEILQELFP